MDEEKERMQPAFLHLVMPPRYENGIPTKKVKQPPRKQPRAAPRGVLLAMDTSRLKVKGRDISKTTKV
jgi:hypothetical protein